MDREDARLIEAALQESERIDASLVRVRPTERAIVLEGTVPSPEEADAAVLVAERLAPEVVSKLSVDSALREGITREAPGEPARQAEDEVLLGSPDPLAGPEAEITSESEQAFSENEPWNPPEDPVLPATADEYRSPPVRAEGERAEPAAPAAPEIRSPDSAGVPPPEGADDFPPRLGDASPGEGVVGEGTSGGGGTSGTPAPESGSKGADTARSDPARSATGTTAGGTGTHRGPEAEDDPATRDEFPQPDPERDPPES